MGYESISIRADGIEKIKLESGGNIYAEKIIVQLAPFPDYVFEDGYKLMSLFELDNFIKLNKHLPGMPSSEEVKEDGGDLGGLILLLTEKVEELTLYTIQQQREIEQLTKTLENQIKKK